MSLPMHSFGIGTLLQPPNQTHAHSAAFGRTSASISPVGRPHSLRQRGLHGGSGLVTHTGQDMAVAVQRHGHRGVVQ
jgi:hypothetical protein